MKRIFSIFFLLIILTSCADYTKYFDTCDFTYTGEMIEADDNYQKKEIVLETMVEKYTYRGSKGSRYSEEYIYYSENYNVLYISYKDNTAITSPGTSLDIDSLRELEEYILENFTSSSEREEYSEIINVIRLYPNSSDTVCPDALGCSNYNEGFIDLYKVNSNNLYTNGDKEPLINTLAHEYGHIFSLFQLHVKGSITADEYLKVRLADKYHSVLNSSPRPSYFDPNIHSLDDYHLLTSEIEADDYVELFFNKRVNYKRESLSENTDIQSLDDHLDIANNLKALYHDIFNLNESYLTDYLVASKASGCDFIYYIDYKINEKKQLQVKTKVNLIVIGAAKHNNLLYLRVLLSGAHYELSSANIETEYANNTGYVLASDYVLSSNQDIYQITDERFANYALLLDNKIPDYAIFGSERYGLFINDNILDDSSFMMYEYNRPSTEYHYIIKETNKLSLIN